MALALPNPGLISRRTALDRDRRYRAFDREAEVRLAVGADRVDAETAPEFAPSGPWSLEASVERPVTDDVASFSIPREAQPLLDALAPYLAVVGDAVAPLLAARGLSPADATVENLLEIEGLADEVLDAAVEAVAGVDAFGSSPRDPGTFEASNATGLLPPGWPDQPSYDFAGHAPLQGRPAPERVRSPVEALPSGWENDERGPVGLMFDEDGDPCYPDAPPFEDYWPKCPEPEVQASDAGEVPCLEDMRFIRAEERLRSQRNFSRVPNSFRGFDYRSHLEDSVSEPIEGLYRCGNNTEHLLASWFGPPSETIRVHEDLLDLEFEWDLVSLLTGPVDFRAAVLLHEHVHRIEDPRVGTVSAPPERSYRPAGSAGQDDCPLSGTEYNAAYIQALYLGAGEPTARMVADIYGRRQCHQLSRGAQLLAAAGDIIEALALGWWAAVEVIATLTARLASGRTDNLLSSLFPSGIAGLLLLTLPL